VSFGATLHTPGGERAGQLTRRAVLAGLAGAATAACAVAGPKVFLDYDQAALDRAYDQRQWASNMDHVIRRYAVNSDAVRTRIGRPRTLAYGPSGIETLDLYPTRPAQAPVLVFLHGGAWRAGKARDYAFAAETFVRAGAHFVVPDFDMVTAVGLDGMVAQARRAVAWLYQNAARFGGDRGRIHVAGHSSGAHLAGNVLVTDWAGQFGLPADVVKGGLCVSGMYDLRPVRLSARSLYVDFDDRIEHEYSAQRHLSRLACPVAVACGTVESPEFRRQSSEFAEAVRRAGRPVSLLVGQGYNHFEIIETLANPYGLLGRAALEQMGLA
jgi:arylformamidase